MRYVVAIAVGMTALASLCSPTLAQTAQQNKMTTCNADASSKNLKGDDRKAFMKTCLSNSTSTDQKPLNSQQQKMRDCNAQAKVMKGNERKEFMSKCLKGNS